MGLEHVHEHGDSEAVEVVHTQEDRGFVIDDLVDRRLVDEEVVRPARLRQPGHLARGPQHREVRFGGQGHAP